MKACTQCGRLYPDDAGFCPIDGQQLTSVSQAPVAPVSGDPRVGAVLCGSYQVRRTVADGGMGRVYEALDLTKNRNVALKVLHPEVANDPVALERFKREFEVSKLLSHEHVVEVFDFQPTGEGSFGLAMEFLYGEELRSALKREKTLPAARVVRMLSQLAIGLDAAHAKRLVHRDLKPENIFLCQTHDGDIVKILDFGSVKDKTENAMKLTVMGTTIGSPYYMSPEQAQGLDTLDQRADVWALAAIVYECVTGRVPFTGNNGPAILLDILTRTPTPASQAGAEQKYPVPPTLDLALSRAFQKNPNQRTSGAGVLADGVGHAYGLTGNYRIWATRCQQDLESEVQERLPTLLRAAPSAMSNDSATDQFFGDSGGLGSIPPPGSLAPRGSERPTVPAGVPKRRSGIILAVLTIVIIVMIVAAIVLLFTL